MVIKELHMIRWFKHFNGRVHRELNVEFNWWTHFCHAYVECDDEGWTVALALPPLAVWVHINGFIPVPTEKHVFTWDNNREVWLPMQRECKIQIHGWTIWVHPWSKSMEWSKGDPWWVRGVSVNIPSLILGRTRCDVVKGQQFTVNIPLPEKTYPANCQVETHTWTRPRWPWWPFKKRRESVWVTIAGGGMPFPGKGENSWDCGMDGLCGYGVDSLQPEVIIAKGVESVLKSRRRYGGSVDWKPPAEPAKA